MAEVIEATNTVEAAALMQVGPTEGAASGRGVVARGLRCEIGIYNSNLDE
jgi:hypothetical protein